MGFRTLVLLQNDHCSDWQDDPELGRKIMIGMNHTHDKGWNTPADLRYGRVVQCCHADEQTVALIDSYHFHPLVHSFWRRGEAEADRDVRLLKELADKLGYRVSKKPEAKHG
jgi:hypothetical protein